MATKKDIETVTEAVEAAAETVVEEVKKAAKKAAPKAAEAAEAVEKAVKKTAKAAAETAEKAAEAVSEAAAPSRGENGPPQGCHGLALADGVGGDEGCSDAVIPAQAGMTSDKLCGFEIPRADEIQHTRAFQRPGHGQQILALLLCHHL